MTTPVPVQIPAGTIILPPLGGGLLLAYRVAWWVLLAAAVAALVLPLFQPDWALAIGVLRTAKSVVLITVSAILYRRRQKDAVAALLALAFLLWTVSSSVDILASSAIPALTDRLRFLFFALALLLFPDGALRPRWTQYVGSTIVVAFLLGAAEALNLLASDLYLPVAIACVLAALAALFQRYQALGPGIQKQQLKWVVLGLVGGIALILTARAAKAVTGDMEMPLGGGIVIEGLFQLGIVVVALGFLTSLLRYRLYDAESAISRSAVYAALTLTLVGTFAASEALVELVGQRLFGMAIGNVSGAVAAAFAAMMLTPLHGRISRWAERRFQHDLVLLKSELPDLLAVLSGSASLNRLTSAILPRIEQAVQASRLAILIDGRLVGVQGIAPASARRMLRHWRPPEGAALIGRDDQDIFPFQLALRCPLGRIRAWLLLGPRPDGSFYGRDDIDALAEIAPPLQRTLWAVAEREAESRSRRRRDAELRRLMSRLSQRVEALESAGKRPAMAIGGIHAQR